MSISVLGQKELELCKEVGIDNKNLLVQAAQSHKKGDFISFIENFKNGSMKTIKEAKEFNKKKTKSIERVNTFNEKCQIERMNKKIIIRCENAKVINEIEAKIRKALADYLD